MFQRLVSRSTVQALLPSAVRGGVTATGGAFQPHQIMQLSSSTDSTGIKLAPSAVSLKKAFRVRLEEAKEAAREGGGHKRVETQHKKGKLTARERLDLLLDENSFRELDMLKTHRCNEFGMDKETYYGDGVITGHGLIHGRRVFVFSQVSTTVHYIDSTMKGAP